MRGKGSSPIACKFAVGITPAYAGKSFRIATKKLRAWDHPRLCGEKLCFVRCRGLAAGSPPPMRGKVTAPSTLMTAFGITPAYAGKRLNYWKRLIFR